MSVRAKLSLTRTGPRGRVGPSPKAKKLPRSTREQVVAALQEEGSSRYEARMRASGRATRIVLPSGGIFWSRGYRGCPFCEQPVDTQVELQPFVYQHGSTITKGWRCQRLPTPATKSSLRVP